MILQVQIARELRARFLQLQIVKGLRERPCRRASTGGMNLSLQRRGGFRPPRKWLNGMRKAPRRPRNLVWDALAAASASRFMLPQSSDQRLRILRVFFMVGRQIASARRKADARTSDRWALAPGGGRDLVGVKFW